MIRLKAAIAALAGGVIAAITGPAGAENVLRWASAGEVLTFDPHSLDETANSIHFRQVYEPLVDLDSDLKLVPMLAVEWKIVDPTTWEFRLREGVSFHDGSPFTADDVIFSLRRAQADTSDWKDTISIISAIEALDPHTVRLTTSLPDMILPTALRNIMIMSKTWAQSHGAGLPADFDAGEQTHATVNANGTGPFELQEFTPPDHVVLARNPDWWGLERYPLNIDRIDYRTIDEEKARLDALLTRKIDFLPDTPLDAIDAIRKSAGLKLAQAPELRTIFLGLDQGSAELRSSNIKGKNPFADRRVREAMYHAIDIEAIRDEVMRGLSIPRGMIIAPGVNGFADDLDKRLSFDPVRAPSLLADAGYREGFTVTLDCPNNRYINDEAICRAVAAQLGEVGIDVTVAARPKGEHWRMLDNGMSDFWLEGWGFPTLDSQTEFQEFFHSRGSRHDETGYANPRVDELIDKIQGTMITYARDAMIEEVWKIVLDDIVYLPLHQQILVWTTRDDLDIPVFPIGRPQFREARFR